MLKAININAPSSLEGIKNRILPLLVGMFLIEIKLSLDLVELALFPHHLIHQIFELTHRDLYALLAAGIRVPGGTFLLVFVVAGLDVLRPHFWLILVVSDLESLALGNGSFCIFGIILADPLSFQVSIGLLEGFDEPNLIIFPPLLLLAHIFLLITLQLDRIFLLSLQVVIDLRLFGPSLQVGLTLILEDTLERDPHIVQGRKILAQFDIDG